MRRCERALRGGNWEALVSQNREVLLAGPAGTGKSRTCLEKLQYLAIQHPGARMAIIRKTRRSLTQSAMVTFQRDVLPPGVAKFHTTGGEYRYTNGSVVVLIGLDDPEKIKSTEFEIAFIQEATELTENDWEIVGSRIRGTTLPYQQLLGDCNPSMPTHWLKQRCDRGDCLMLTSRHEDNPALHDGTQWTAFGEQYLARLALLSGVRRARLLEGKWAAAEGLVYDAWDPSVHVVDRFPIPAEWRRFRAIDFGYTNPFVCQWWAVDGDGRMYLYREMYQTGLLVEDAAKEIARLSEGENIEATVTDHDAEDRATLERYLGHGTIPALKAVQPGIQAVAARIRIAGDGRPRLFMVRDALVQVDTALRASGRPCCTIEEMEGYIWDTRQGKPPKEQPVKDNDHGNDACRYGCMYLDGSAPAAGGSVDFGDAWDAYGSGSSVRRVHGNGVSGRP